MSRRERFRYDVLMSLHRRAYCLIEAGGKLDAFYAGMRTVCKAFADDPIYQALHENHDAWDQFWRTAQAAVDAGMSARQAFPLLGDLYMPQPPALPYRCLGRFRGPTGTEYWLFFQNGEPLTVPHMLEGMKRFALEMCGRGTTLKVWDCNAGEFVDSLTVSTEP